MTSPAKKKLRIPYGCIHITLLKYTAGAALLAALLVISGCQGFNPADLTPRPLSTVSATTPPASPTTRPNPTLSPAPTFTPEPVSAINVRGGALSEVTLRFWMPQFDGWMPGTGGSELQDMVNEFNQHNEWGIRIETTTFDDYEGVYGAIQSAFQTDFPDVVLGYTFQSAGLDRTVRRIVDLDYFVQDTVWGIRDDEFDFFPAFWEAEVVEGKRLGIPLYRLAHVMYYNSTWGRELGFDGPPGNQDQFKAQVCAASAQRDAQPAGPGGWSFSTDAPAVLSWIYAFGGEVAEPEQRKYSFASPEGIEALTVLKGLYDQGCAWLERTRDPADDFAARHALVVSGSLGMIPALEAALVDAGNVDEWAVMPFPAPDGQTGINAYGPSLSILETTDEKEFAAWLFIRWLVDGENQARVVRAAGAFPTRTSALESLGAYGQANPRWAEAQSLLEYARPEPGFHSWGQVRWVVSDAVEFLFSPFFAPDEVETLLVELDRTAAELHNRRR